MIFGRMLIDFHCRDLKTALPTVEINTGLLHEIQNAKYTDISQCAVNFQHKFLMQQRLHTTSIVQILLTPGTWPRTTWLATPSAHCLWQAENERPNSF